MSEYKITDYAHILKAIADGVQVQIGAKSNGRASLEWRDEDAGNLLATIAEANFAPERFRIKPQTMEIQKFAVPRALHTIPQLGEKYWVVGLRAPICLMWSGCEDDFWWFNSQLCYNRRELAVEASEILAKAFRYAA